METILGILLMVLLLGVLPWVGPCLIQINRDVPQKEICGNYCAYCHPAIHRQLRRLLRLDAPDGDDISSDLE